MAPGRGPGPATGPVPLSNLRPPARRGLGATGSSESLSDSDSAEPGINTDPIGGYKSLGRRRTLNGTFPGPRTPAAQDAQAGTELRRSHHSGRAVAGPGPGTASLTRSLQLETHHMIRRQPHTGTGTQTLRQLKVEIDSMSANDGRRSCSCAEHSAVRQSGGKPLKPCTIGWSRVGYSE
jgi:hypothetical protein